MRSPTNSTFPERFTDFDIMLAAADVDAVYIVTPPKAVFPLAMAALEEGKHVFMEKPPGMTPEETRKNGRGRRRQPLSHDGRL